MYQRVAEFELEDDQAGDHGMMLGNLGTDRHTLLEQVLHFHDRDTYRAGAFPPLCHHCVCVFSAGASSGPAWDVNGRGKSESNRKIISGSQSPQLGKTNSHHFEALIDSGEDTDSGDGRDLKPSRGSLS